MGTQKGGETLRNTMIERYMNNYPGYTREQAYEAWKADMRANASTGGRNGTGHAFGHGYVDPSVAGAIGGKKSRRKPKS